MSSVPINLLKMIVAIIIIIIILVAVAIYNFKTSYETESSYVFGHGLNIDNTSWIDSYDNVMVVKLFGGSMYDITITTPGNLITDYIAYYNSDEETLSLRKSTDVVNNVNNKGLNSGEIDLFVVPDQNNFIDMHNPNVWSKRPLVSLSDQYGLNGEYKLITFKDVDVDTDEFNDRFIEYDNAKSDYLTSIDSYNIATSEYIEINKRYDEAKHEISVSTDDTMHSAQVLFDEVNTVYDEKKANFERVIKDLTAKQKTLFALERVVNPNVSIILSEESNIVEAHINDNGTQLITFGYLDPVEQVITLVAHGKFTIISYVKNDKQITLTGLFENDKLVFERVQDIETK